MKYKLIIFLIIYAGSMLISDEISDEKIINNRNKIDNAVKIWEQSGDKEKLKISELGLSINHKNPKTTELEIIDKIDSFYNNSWNKLMGLLGIIFLIIPMILGFLFWIRISQANKVLEAKIDNKFSDLQELLIIRNDKKLIEIKENINQSLKAEFDNKIEALSKKIKCDIAGLEGGQYHVQGNSQDFTNQKIESFLTAGAYYIDAKDERNLTIVLDLIIKLMPKITVKEKGDLKTQYFEFIEVLEDLDGKSNGRYDSNIIELRKLIT